MISRKSRQGLPTAITLAGMYLVTTLPEPMIVFLPIVTPWLMVTLAPTPLQPQ
ncbi:hypothetical protein [Enterococcus sp. DIV0756]|uniref:hypothetical protein n=1 Tax=Enterococcus sp. DIV0756 TaxID=2774636 RepID=UPI003F683ABE